MAKHDAMKGYERGYKKGPTSQELAKKEPGMGRSNGNMPPQKTIYGKELNEAFSKDERPVTDKMGHGGHHVQVQGFGAMHQPEGSTSSQSE